MVAQSVLYEIKLFNYVFIIVFTVDINEYMNFKCENDHQLNLRCINTLKFMVIIMGAGQQKTLTNVN